MYIFQLYLLVLCSYFFINWLFDQFKAIYKRIYKKIERLINKDLFYINYLKRLFKKINIL